MTITIRHPSRTVAVATVGTLGLVLAFALGGSGRRSLAAAPVTPGPTQPAAATSGVTVGGTGMVSGTPDVLRLDLGVEVRAGSVGDALSGADGALTKVRDTLKRHGVAAKDLQTAGLSVQPDYDYSTSRPRLRGYVATESLSATLRALRSAGGTVSAAVAAGGDAVRVNGISLDLEGDSALVRQARDRAYADAQAKAEQYARLAGRHLGAVLSITESVQGADPVPLEKFADSTRLAAGTPVPIEAGSRTVSVRVQAVWSLG